VPQLRSNLRGIPAEEGLESSYSNDLGRDKPMLPLQVSVKVPSENENKLLIQPHSVDS